MGRFAFGGEGNVKNRKKLCMAFFVSLFMQTIQMHDKIDSFNRSQYHIQNHTQEYWNREAPFGLKII